MCIDNNVDIVNSDNNDDIVSSDDSTDESTDEDQMETIAKLQRRMQLGAVWNGKVSNKKNILN